MHIYSSAAAYPTTNRNQEPGIQSLLAHLVYKATRFHFQF